MAYMISTNSKMIYVFHFIHQKKITKMEHPELNVLIDKVVDKMNEIEVTANREEIKQAILRQTNIAYPNSSDVAQFVGQKPRKKLTLASVTRAAAAIVNLSRGVTVTQSELDRRAKICTLCSERSTVTDCMSCGAGAKIADTINKLRALKGKDMPNVPKHVEKNACRVCECYIPFLLVTNFSDIKDEEKSVNESRPDNCWMKKSSTNYTQQ